MNNIPVLVSKLRNGTVQFNFSFTFEINVRVKSTCFSMSFKSSALHLFAVWVKNLNNSKFTLIYESTFY
jgi:hypothetical protein